jgi:pilus assembly protein FimV
MPPRATALIIACAASALGSEANAIGFGRVSASAVLGQTLNLPVPLRIEPGESIAPQCASAEITAGESQIGRDHVKVRLEPASNLDGTANWVAHVQTDTVIVEPVLDIVLTVGCDRRFSRRFVAFADPPSAVATPAALSPPAPAAQLPLARATGDARSAQTSRAASPALQQRSRHVAAGAAAASATASANRRAPATQKKSTQASAPSIAQQPSTNARLLLDVGAPRLKLDWEEPLLTAAPAPADGAASAAAATESSPDGERLRALDKSLSDLKRENQSNREAAAVLKARLAEADTRGRAVPWLASLLILTLAVIAWLAFRVRREQDGAAGSAPWWTPAAAPAAVSGNVRHQDDLPAPEGDDLVDLTDAPTTPMPMEALLDLEQPEPRLPSASAGPAWHTAEPLFERTAVLSAPSPISMREPATVEPAAAREVTVEELLDLEQQADFFIALGQEDAAVDLLMSHLRSTGGMSPLPYIKLFEIYRRQNDREAYERIRARFNRRFNAYAPDWEAGPLSGKTLEENLDAVRQLQSLWPEPLDAMAMLEAMLFRKDDAQQLFDLPAYKDVLLLYAIARDLWQQSGSRQGGVDVLLPLDEVSPSEAGWQEVAGALAESSEHGTATIVVPPRPHEHDDLSRG